MFSKIIDKENKNLTEPNSPNRQELLKEIRNNNCREIIVIDINLKVLAKDKFFYPDRKTQIDQIIQQLNSKKKDLIIGVEYIDQELKKYAGQNKTGEENRVNNFLG